jgi:uncharacterized protein YjeT (DUF2065 family)
MAILPIIARFILIAHGLMNIAQGIYSLASPQGYGTMAGEILAGSPDRTLQLIGE